MAFPKVEVSNPERGPGENCMRNVGRTGVERNSLGPPIVHSLYDSLHDGRLAPTRVVSRVPPRFSYSREFQRTPAPPLPPAAVSGSLIPPGRRITRPSAYDFIRGSNWLSYSPSDHEHGASEWRLRAYGPRGRRNNIAAKGVNARQNIDKADHSYETMRGRV